VKHTNLDALLAAAQAADANVEAPPRVEDGLRIAYREALRAAPAAGPPRGFGLRAARDWLWAGLAAAVTVAALLAVARPPRAPSGPAVAEADAEGAFTPLVYGDPWSDVEAVQVVRVEMPRTALSALGYVGSAPVPDVATAVRADLLVGNDGIARGIRFVR
jgi:hypothetical protein